MKLAPLYGLVRSGEINDLPSELWFDPAAALAARISDKGTPIEVDWSVFLGFELGVFQYRENLPYTPQTPDVSSAAFSAKEFAGFRGVARLICAAPLLDHSVTLGPNARSVCATAIDEPIVKPDSEHPRHWVRTMTVPLSSEGVMRLISTVYEQSMAKKSPIPSTPRPSSYTTVEDDD
jgi:hypothetical protein